MSDASVEYTLVVVKPDGLKKSLTGNILTKLAEARFMAIQ
jgi:nucleoside-diphosphate kinase